jgi:hypothetical protein
MPEARRKDAGGWRDVAASLNRIGGQCRARGFEFAYHNHAFEFVKFTLRDAADPAKPTDSSQLEKTGLDILLDNTDPAW